MTLKYIFAPIDKKQVYPFRIKDGAFQEMRNILRFPEVTGPEIDGQTCRGTVTAYSVDLALKKNSGSSIKTTMFDWSGCRETMRGILS